MSEMKQTDRIRFIIDNLKINSFTIHDLKEKIEANFSSISIRQIQRDLLDVEKFLNEDEIINTFRLNYLKFYKIDTRSAIKLNYINDGTIIETNFYHQNLINNNIENLELLKQAIKGFKSIIISNLINDETGDNYDFTSTNIFFIPLKIINHRNAHYVGGLNIKKKIIQIFGINQLNKISISKTYNFQFDLHDKLQNQLNGRFGISKNIDSNIYDIKIEVSSVLAGFIKNHYWHHSQKFTKRSNNLILHLKCGINRELIGWLFQWMYNIRIIEPQILKDYYDKTIYEIQSNLVSRNPLVYKNIFIEED
jgi:WYL domain